MIRLFSKCSNFMHKKKEMAHQIPSEAFLEPSPDTAMHFHPSGVPTHLPLSNPFRTYLPKTLLEVTSWDEILTTSSG